MSEEQMRILKMVEEGKIDAEEAARLLGALDGEGAEESCCEVHKVICIKADCSSGNAQETSTCC